MQRGVSEFSNHAAELRVLLLSAAAVNKTHLRPNMYNFLVSLICLVRPVALSGLCSAPPDRSSGGRVVKVLGTQPC